MRRLLGHYGLPLAVVVILTLPLALRGPSCGQDADFHLQNWLEVNRSWHQLVFYPHWAASANYGAGEPRFIFYPPLSWLLGAALGSVLPWTWTPFAFVLLAMLAAAVSFRIMAREWMSDRAATLAACLYVANPYLVFVAYERGALAELLAAVWIPLLVLYGLRNKPSALPLALTIAAIWLTNAPAGTMGSYMLAILVLIAALQQKSWALIRRALCAVPVGLGLAAFWLVPALYEQRWVQIARAIGPLMRVQDSFLFGYVSPRRGATSDQAFAAAYHNLVLHMASWVVVSLVISLVTALVAARRPRSPLWMPLATMGVLIAALQFRWSGPLWRLVPELKFLQFPWRWMLVLGMIAAALAGFALHPAPRLPQKSRQRRLLIPPSRFGAIRALAVLLLAAGMAGLAAAHFWQPCDEEDNVRAQMATFRDTGFSGTDEYTPRGADNSAVQQGLPRVRVLSTPSAESALEEDNPDWEADPKAELPAQIRIARWNNEHMSAAISTDRPGYAVLRLMDYPAWRVTRNGSVVAARLRRSDGLMVVPLTAGRNQIDVRWVTTGDAWAGRGISLTALAITLALALKERRKARAVPIP